MSDLRLPFDLPKSIPQHVMLAVLNRCDDTREFMLEMWKANPHLAKQGGNKVAMLLSSKASKPPTQDDITHHN